MRILSFKIIVLCIVLPLVVYIASTFMLERYLDARYARDIENSYLGDMGPLLEGSLPIKEVIARNIDFYLKGRTLIKLGLEVHVTVTTRKGSILYPAVFEQTDNPPVISTASEVARENFALMNEGIVLAVWTEVEHTRLLSHALLIFCVLLSVTIIYLHYRVVANKIKIEEDQRNAELSNLQKLEQENTHRLGVLEYERGNLQSEFDVLKEILEDEKKKAARNEDELIEEIESLEARLKENIAQQESQKQDILKLKDQIDNYDLGIRKAPQKKSKAAALVSKRFNTLYKNLFVSERALSGFLSLNDELKIKAEEIIHQLNADSGQVKIKRKVFGGKGHKTVYEVVFGYKGRLYFCRTKDKRIEIWAIGTKNTQARELEFLAGL